MNVKQTGNNVKEQLTIDCSLWVRATMCNPHRSNKLRQQNGNYTPGWMLCKDTA